MIQFDSDSQAFDSISDSIQFNSISIILDDISGTVAYMPNEKTNSQLML